MFGARVKALSQYYLDSRKARTKDDVVDLLVADRIKQTLSDACLQHVLSAEGAEWFKPDKLVDVIDAYVNSRLCMSREVGRSDATRTRLVTNVGNARGVTGINKPIGQLRSFAGEEKPVVRCWICHQRNHRAYNCKMQGRDTGKAAGAEIRKSPGSANDKVTAQSPHTQKSFVYDRESAPKANSSQTQAKVSHVNIQNCNCNLDLRHSLSYAKLANSIPDLI